MLTHTGPARVFDSEEDAIAAIYAGKIVPGDVVVIRYEGPKGGPGMREMLNPTSALAGMGLDKTAVSYTHLGAAGIHFVDTAHVFGHGAADNDGHRIVGSGTVCQGHQSRDTHLGGLVALHHAAQLFDQPSDAAVVGDHLRHAAAEQGLSLIHI